MHSTFSWTQLVANSETTKWNSCFGVVWMASAGTGTHTATHAMHNGAINIQQWQRVGVVNSMAKVTQADGTKAKAKNEIDSSGACDVLLKLDTYLAPPTLFETNDSAHSGCHLGDALRRRHAFDFCGLPIFDAILIEKIHAKYLGQKWSRASGLGRLVLFIFARGKWQTKFDLRCVFESK